jgi:hypothetical protein
MSNTRSPQQALPDLLRRKSAQRTSSESRADRTTVRGRIGAAAASDVLLKTAQERIAARFGAIARAKATEKAAQRRPRRNRPK